MFEDNVALMSMGDSWDEVGAAVDRYKHRGITIDCTLSWVGLMVGL